MDDSEIQLALEEAVSRHANIVRLAYCRWGLAPLCVEAPEGRVSEPLCPVSAALVGSEQAWRADVDALSGGDGVLATKAADGRGVVTYVFAPGEAFVAEIDWFPALGTVGNRLRDLAAKLASGSHPISPK